MKVGVKIFATDRTMPMHKLAPEVERRGFESLWVPEKTHVPTSRKTVWPGGELPWWYLRTCDPFVVLAAAAATTTILRIGTGVALLALRDPVVTAKTIATLDWQSEGRLELGVGYGWSAEELATHGVTLDDAAAQLDDSLSLMKALWNDDEGSHSGPYFSVEPCWSWPKPVQPGGPPIHLGARASKEGFRDIARWGDGWLPIEGYGTILNHVESLRNAFSDADRDPESAIISVYSSSGDPAILEQYADAGIDRVLCTLSPADESIVMPELEALTVRLDEHLTQP